jgi:hypothetical protein
VSGIFWLPSYPKSGNTWLRTLLTNYRRDENEPVDINRLDGIGLSRNNFDELLGIESSDLTQKQIEHYLPFVYEWLAAESNESLFLKVHDAFGFNTDGRAIFSKQATAGAIYLIRNPLDVAVSYAHHRDQSIDATIQFMNCESALLDGSNKAGGQLPQKLMSWSKHVSSWTGAADLNIHVVRYEDMIRQPVKVFTGIVRFIGLDVDSNRLQKAVEFSRFEKLRAQELAHGFAEKQPTARSFFRRGETGSWRDSLSQAQIEQLITDHRAVMQQFGYLTSDDEILF